MPEVKMRRIQRDRRLTFEEAGKYNAIRAQIADELPDLVAGHRERRRTGVSLGRDFAAKGEVAHHRAGAAERSPETR